MKSQFGIHRHIAMTVAMTLRMTHNPRVIAWLARNFCEMTAWMTVAMTLWMTVVLHNAS